MSYDILSLLMIIFIQDLIYDMEYFYDCLLCVVLYFHFALSLGMCVVLVLVGHLNIVGSKTPEALFFFFWFFHCLPHWWLAIYHATFIIYWSNISKLIIWSFSYRRMGYYTQHVEHQIMLLQRYICFCCKQDSFSLWSISFSLLFLFYQFLGDQQ